MRTKEQSKTAVAGIVGRWQVDDLHDGHQLLLSEVFKHHEKVIIFVGVTHVLGSLENPLDYPTVVPMLQLAYPTATVLPIANHGSDEIWSQNLDSLIRTVAPIGKVTLYGGRDSFINKYH